MIPLKSREHSAEIEGFQVDQIFYQVPEILKFHETFLDTLKGRLSYWDTKQKIGDVFVDVFTRPTVVDTYIEFINNWKTARDAIKSTSLAKPAFAKFLEHTSREHKGKLTLDALLIMPVQRIPRYELLIKELLKHTPMDHPDYKLLLQAQKEVHDLAIKINKVEREALLQEQTIQKLKEVEQLIEGVADLIQGDRAFIRHDFVQIPGGLGMKKERCVFLFSDLLLISSIKKKGG
ncbi:Rho guanine nucleotide exchange factor 17, partial [Stegodyphus mimosarum]